MTAFNYGKINQHLYREDEGLNLMKPEYFTEKIKGFHRQEWSFFSKIAAIARYRLLIEVGCSDYRLVSLKPDGCEYLGIDMIPLPSKRNPAKSAAVICCEASRFFMRKSNVRRLRLRSTGRLLCVLPFNFLGTMDDPIGFLHILCKSRFDIGLSLFGTSDEATKARVAYYNKCRLMVNEIERTPDFVKLVCSNGFKAFAFSSAFIRKFMTNHGYATIDADFEEISYIMQFRVLSDD